MDFGIIFVFTAIIATIFGGYLAFSLRRHLKLLVAFSAGLLISIAFFDLIPEAFGALPGQTIFVSLSLVVGFLAYFILEKFILMHSCFEPHECETHSHSGFSGMAGLVLHRLLDGIVLGISLKASPETALMVGIAITIHSVPDGINSVTVLLLKKQKQLVQWLLTVSSVLFIGFIATFFIALPEKVLGLLLGFVAGWFIYLGASDLMPEAHKERSISLLFATICGFAFVIALILLLPRV